MFLRIIHWLFASSLLINAALFIPQFMRLLKTKNSEELSFWTFFGFNLIQLIAIVYEYTVHDYASLLGFLANFLTCGALTALIVYYRIKKIFRN